jgi:hypothetical protein
MDALCGGYKISIKRGPKRKSETPPANPVRKKIVYGFHIFGGIHYATDQCPRYTIFNIDLMVKSWSVRLS